MAGQKENDEKAEKAQKEKVDRMNKKKADDIAKAEAMLAKTPLNDEEKAFVAKMKPKLSEGRAIMQPTQAEMLRYSQLIKRIDVKAKE